MTALERLSAEYQDLLERLREVRALVNEGNERAAALLILLERPAA